jgi:hypothetical protein
MYYTVAEMVRFFGRFLLRFARFSPVHRNNEVTVPQSSGHIGILAYWHSRSTTNNRPHRNPATVRYQANMMSKNIMRNLGSAAGAAGAASKGDFLKATVGSLKNGAKIASEVRLHSIGVCSLKMKSG